MRIVPPGVDDPTHRLNWDTVYPLTNVVIDALRDTPYTGRLEFLSVSGDTHQEHLLTPLIASSSSAKLDTTIQAGLGAFDGESVVAPSTTDALGTTLQQSLPEEIGLEHVSVDLSTLGLTPVATGRLALLKDQGVTPINAETPHPLVQMSEQVAALDKPYIVQAIVDTSTKADYTVAVRYAVFHPDHTIARDVNIQAHLTDGKQFPIESVWHGLNLMTNFDLPIEDFYTRNGREWVPDERKYLPQSATSTARDLYTGKAELKGLLRATHGSHPLYKQRNWNARIPIVEAALRYFAAFIPQYYDSSPWNDVPGRNPPQIDTESVIRSAAGTDQGLGTATDISTNTTRSSRVANEGSDTHAALLRFTLQWNREQGHDAEEVDQNTSSVPDGERSADTSDGPVHPDDERSTDSDELVNLEVESKNKSKPANILANYARAHEQGQPVEFITADKTTA
jgi:hypothetical protein